jgi:hypothetical protein
MELSRVAGASPELRLRRQMQAGTKRYDTAVVSIANEAIFDCTGGKGKVRQPASAI